MRSSEGRLSIVGNDSIDSRPPLDYLQPSPVRGQLENYKEKTRAGWRFLQCTDTPDELKVLLPPRTAQIYSQLLAAETSELAKSQDASWERILDIRRLKDRMIRKCGRLSRVWGGTKPGAGTLFRTVYAPADFRLKEMEKWIRYQENPGRAVMTATQTIDAGASRRTSMHHNLKHKGSFCCDRCAAAGPPPETDHPPTHRRRATVARSSNRGSWIDQPETKQLHPTRHASTSSVHSISIQDGINSYSQTVYRASTAIQDSSRNIHAVLEPYPEHPRSIPHRQSALFAAEEGLMAESPRVLSPDPLPHPYRHSLQAIITDDDSTDDTTDSETALSPVEKDISVDPKISEDTQTRPPLVHRRSSLKKSSVSNRASMDAKNVAWAMDQEWQDQVKKFDDASNDAERADREWDAAKTTYEEELMGMKALRENLSLTLAKLRIETEKLEREDEVMRVQEGKLRESYKQLEETQLRYRAKVQSVLDETKGVLTLCQSKRV